MGSKNNKLVGYRKMACLTQNDMAEYLGINQTTYSKKENGSSEFTQKEMNRAFEILKSRLGDVYQDLKITDIFFANINA